MSVVTPFILERIAASLARQGDEMAKLSDQKIKAFWLHETPTIEAQRIRMDLAQELGFDHNTPRYVLDLIDIAAQRGIKFRHQAE